MKKDQKPSADDRRPKDRRSILVSGIVAYQDGACHFDCAFRDLSDTGARIVVSKNSQCPEEFFLINLRDRIAYDSKLVWNDGKELGVTFKKKMPLSAITDPKLAYLKRLWMAKATG